MPTISVIVPVFNVEKYLCCCVDSILAQTFTDIEVLLVDDGSTDASGTICDAYAQQDSRVRVFHKENGGASSARNLGLNEARGSLIGFVDSDDFITKDLYETVLTLQEKYQADMVEFGVCRDYEMADRVTEQYFEKAYSGVEMLSRLYCDCIGGSVYPFNKLYRRELFQKNRFVEGRINEDTLLMPKLYFEAKMVAVTNKCMYCYVQSENSVMRSGFSLKRMDAVYAYQNNREFYQAHQLKEALEYHDATYAFLLLRMGQKIKETYGAENGAYRECVQRFVELFPEFMRNRRINLRQKIYLAKERRKLQ